MPADFSACFDHGLGWDELYRVPDLLNEARLHLKLAWLPDAPWQWNRLDGSSVREELFNLGFAAFNGPCGFSGSVSVGGIQIDHVERWSVFLTDEGVRASLERASAVFGQVFRATRWIYLPDSWPEAARASDLLLERKSLTDVIAWLRQHCGPPAPSIEAIDREANGDGYFIAEARTST